MIAIRPYREADCELLRKIFARAVSETAIRDYTPEQIRIWAAPPLDFAERLIGRPTFVAELDGEIAGFSDVDDCGHIDFLYVNPDFQRRGIATALLTFIIDRARRTGMPLLSSDVSVTARVTFERAGFKVRKPQTVIVNDCAFLNFVMDRSSGF
ncbi:MAG TPA: GNAT family N-acetyltransferase [Rhizomicrobium sp.]|nr:GNAT family N-acetyltransferase [Rhizomicrobium sp.]